MQLDRVTITGADDSVEPADLLALSRMYPFVEWGILLSKNGMGKPRFPTADWLWKFRDMARRFPIQASMHVCGRWLREMLIGSIPSDLGMFIDCFQRVQLNFGAEPLEYKFKLFGNALESLSDDGQREFIFQICGPQSPGPALFLQAIGGDACFDVDCFPLFDASGGAGVLPSEWPMPIDKDIYHGYAGGLGPDNLAEQLPRIAEAAVETRIWIDMESRVRSADDRQFDLAKVRQCLEIAKPFVVEAS